MKITPWVPPESGTQFNNAAEKHNAIAYEYEEQYNIVYWKLYDALTWDHMSQNILKDGVPEKMLDAGGGTGKWSRRFIKQGVKKIELIDLAENMINVGKQYAKEEGMEDKITFSKSDICTIPFEDNTFDAVISQGNPVSYCSDSEKAIKELARVAKKGAPVVISVHNKFAMMSYYTYFMGKIGIDETLEFAKTSRVRTDYPVYAFTPDELVRVCEESDLEVVSIIGKPCISGFVQSDCYISNLENEDFFRKSVELEEKLWEEKSIMGMAGHLEIACIKK